MDRTLNRKFRSFVLPSMLAMAFSGIYSIIDGIFIGNFLGDTGIAAINIAYPLQAVVLAVGTGIGLGGGILISISAGKDDHDMKNRYLGTTLMTLFAAALILLAVLYPLHPYILKLLVKEDALYPLTLQYLKPLLLFSCVQLFATGIVPIIRNYGGAMFSMVGMITGFLMNIVLDWLLIAKFPLGLTGAALATLLGQLSSLLVCLSFFLFRRGILKSADFTMRWSTFRNVLHSGLSPFGETINPNIGLMIMNYFVLRAGGVPASSTYGVICYVYFVGLLFIQGIGQGAQPLVSMYHGAGDRTSKKHIVSLMYRTSFFFYILMGLALFFTRDHIPFLFGASEEVGLMYRHAILCFIVSLGVFSLVQIDISERYATGKMSSSAIMIYGQSVFTFIYALLFTKIFGTEGAWWVQTAQLLTVGLIQLIFIAKEKKLEAHHLSHMPQA